jgi:thymidylate synthase ThyX
MTYAKVILDSVAPNGSRLTTIEGELHRFCLAELNTHRAFSRNSASSRAIPVHKQIARIMKDPALPYEWPLERPGMQGGEELPNDAKLDAVGRWLRARDSAVEYTQELVRIGVHKSVTNRLLEPFMWHRVIISSTEAGWQNFFNLRCSPLAQPEFRVFADHVHRVYNMSVPSEPFNGWHMPYLTSDDEVYSINDAKRISAARCALVSYNNLDGTFNPQKDLERYYKLASARPIHASPMEHVARPSDIETDYYHQGNFDGWEQFRHDVERGAV